MNIPSRIVIKTIRKVEGELKEIEYSVPFEFNFNSTNAFRKKKGIEYSEFVEIFAGLKDMKFEANESVCELLYCAIQEGCRICQEDMPDISLEDIIRYLNSDAEVFTFVLKEMQGNMQEETDEKKNTTRS